MAVTRSLLHLSKLDEFAAWAETKGYKRFPPVGPYEVLRLRKEGELPLIYHRRDSAEHATIPNYPKEAYGLVVRWLRARDACTPSTQPENS